MHLQPPVAPELRERVIELRRNHSLREVSEIAGLPLGTVKAITSRSGRFRDNETHRQLFSLPPIHPNTQTLPAVPELPPRRTVTGDGEVDALLWLRELIATGQAPLIDKAMQAAKRLKSPLAELEARHRDHLVSTNPGNMFAALSSFNMADLKALARKSIERNVRRVEARARFGDALHAANDAELFCIEALAGLKPTGRHASLDEREISARFRARPALMPNTLADVVHELGFWRDLDLLRAADLGHGADSVDEAYAREKFVFGLLAEIRPRSRDEAKSALRCVVESGRMDDSKADAILNNIIG